jgi:hypothetical protein
MILPTFTYSIKYDFERNSRHNWHGKKQYKVRTTSYLESVSFTSLGENLPINETFYMKIYSGWLYQTPVVVKWSTGNDGKAKEIVIESNGFTRIGWTGWVNHKKYEHFPHPKDGGPKGYRCPDVGPFDPFSMKIDETDKRLLPFDRCTWVGDNNNINNGICVYSNVKSITCNLLTKEKCDLYQDEQSYIPGVRVIDAPCIFNGNSFNNEELFCVSKSILLCDDAKNRRNCNSIGCVWVEGNSSSLITNSKCISKVFILYIHTYSFVYLFIYLFYINII